jgi:Kef-type K+ transport system membrane component KefB
MMAGVFPAMAWASDDGSHLDPVAPVILWVTVIFFFGILGRYLARRLNQPGVLGELLMGVLVGNICYFFGMPLAIVLREGSAIFSIMSAVMSGQSFNHALHAVIPDTDTAVQMLHALKGSQGIELLKIAYVLDIFARYGVIFLLFMVGLETSMTELKRTGRQSLQVAVMGVVAPMVLGLLVTFFLMPEASFTTDLFVAATLSATSIGITARVLKDMKTLHTREAKTILGAAMIDDVLGLIILAIVSSMVIHGVIDLITIIRVVVLSGIFFIGAISLGPWVLQKMTSLFQFLELWETKLFTSFLFVMCLSWFATLVQLASIIGAFVAGIVIHDGFFASTAHAHKKEFSIQDLMAPLEAILAPLFFMLIGIQVKLEMFYDRRVLFIAAGLILAAIIGKLLSGLGGSRRDDRLLIGIGMLPRGEVGLVFASIGKTIGVMSDQLFSAIILMVIVTTILAPLWLKTRLSSHNKRLPLS